jgi:hypothetical protein
VKNYLAERILSNPQTIVEMRPSQLIEQGGRDKQPQQQQPRFENQNRPQPGGAPTSNANSGSNANRK